MRRVDALPHPDHLPSAPPPSIRAPPVLLSFRAFTLALLAIAITCAPLRSQLGGVVSDPEGQPVAVASVELWTGLRKSAVIRSDSAGRFAAPSAAGPTTAIVVRRLGFEPFTTAVAASDTFVAIRLQRAPVMLAGVTAVASARLCPTADQPQARRLWEAASRRYPATTDTFVFHSLGRHRAATVDSAPRLPDGAPWERAWTAGGTRGWEHTRRWIPALGYAFRSNGEVSGPYGPWEYVSLEWVFAQHFADPLFGELHALRLVGTAGGETTIAFCRRDRGRQREVEGTITLAPDTTFRHARWRYLTPRPVEDAGAEAIFLPPSEATRSFLLVESYRFWRRVAPNRFHVDERRFDEWRLYPGDLAPPLPREFREIQTASESRHPDPR
ncbi:MAG TPA: carboxypeptidase-like regulatory domain-containing protein [Longimicrobium sp.]|nr:carboxypeptidase-like regulatory domain-containing protein [Longimicrobium sp.]